MVSLWFLIGFGLVSDWFRFGFCRVPGVFCPLFVSDTIWGVLVVLLGLARDANSFPSEWEEGKTKQMNGPGQIGRFGPGRGHFRPFWAGPNSLGEEKTSK